MRGRRKFITLLGADDGAKLREFCYEKSAPMTRPVCVRIEHIC
jgi:hypothetical protein